MNTLDVLSDRVLRRDIAAGLSAKQARFLVDYYYAVQDYRIQASGQVRALSQGADEGMFSIGEGLASRMQSMEQDIQKALGEYANAHIPGLWARSIIGIGPVLAAGLLAHIDIEQAPTVGHIWRFAGLDDPANYEWSKGEKRPWNAKLKVLCWKIGDSFVKQSGRESDIYGKVYRARKEQEVHRNEIGQFKPLADRALAERKFKDKGLRQCYESGRLPDGRIDLRARRYAVKLFLAHYHHVAYEVHYDEPPPKPYMMEHHGHVHFIGPPHWEARQVV